MQQIDQLLTLATGVSALTYANFRHLCLYESRNASDLTALRVTLRGRLMELNNRDYVARALELAVEGLKPFVVDALTPQLPEGLTWTDLLEERDRSNSIRGKVYSPNDLQALLRVITERMGNLGYPFSERLSRDGQRLASELRDTRNDWAHHAEFSDSDTYRAVDTTERLLRGIGAIDTADRALALRAELRVDAPADAVPPIVPSAVLPLASSTAVSSTAEPAAVPLGVVAPVGSAVTVCLAVVPVLSYAAAHNRLAVINSVTITNNGPAIRGAVVRASAASALGSLTSPTEQYVDLAGYSSVTLTEIALRLDAAQMLLVEERRPASVNIVIESDGVTLADAHAEVELLAAHQWVNEPQNLGLELLAAFVQPNSPAIKDFMSEVSDALTLNTGSGSLQGYQADDSRVDQIVQAIYEAMQARRIRYSNPPASWGDEGQKVRTPEEVLNGRMGTCLDTTLVMAAAMEQAGLNPQLWLAKGHAFVGYWRSEQYLGLAASTEPRDVMNLVDLGAIGLVETTRVTESENPVSFDTARRLPVTQWVNGNPDQIVGITDIVAARLAHIFPIPARSRAEDGTATVVEYRPQEANERHFADYEKKAGERSPGAQVPYRVAQWKNSLLDLSLRNRLINFTDTGRLSLSVADGDVAHLEDIINDSKSITLIASDDLPEVVRARGIRYGRDLPEADRTAFLRDKGSAFADLTAASYLTRLRNLAYKAKTIEEETGANNLYLAFGTLVWDFNGRTLRSPLVLVPVKVELARGSRYRVVLDESGTSTPNYCLLEKLKQTNNLLIPGLAEPTDDGSGIDLEAAFRATRLAVNEAGLPFRLESTVDLSILQFAKFRLWKDLDENWEELAKNSLVDHLINTPTQEFIDPKAGSPERDLDDLGALSPVQADSSQLAAIAAAVADQTFVLEGPPGTGKSQTITNLLVRAIAEGKKVLFVAEKRAALEVVQRRLAEVGLAPFALDLHDKGSRPAAVRAQIKAALHHRVSSDEDGLRSAQETLDSSRRTLARYAVRMHEQNAAGFSFYSARTRFLAADEATPVLEVPEAMVKLASSEEVDRLLHLFRTLPEVADPARPTADNTWEMIDSPTGVDQRAVLTAFAELDRAVLAVSETNPLRAIVDSAVRGEDFVGVAGLAKAPPMAIADADAAATPEWKAKTQTALARLTAFSATERPWLEGIDPQIIDLPLAAIHADAVAADTSGFFGRKKRRLAVRARLTAMIETATLPLPRAVSALTAQLEVMGGEIAELRSLFAEIPGLVQAPDWNPLTEPTPDRIPNAASWLGWVSQVLTSIPADRADFLSAVRAYFSGRVTRDDEGAAKLEAMAMALATAGASLSQSATHPLISWAGSARLVPKWRTTIGQRDVVGVGVSSLARWVDLLAHVEPLRAAGMLDSRSDILHGRLDPEAALPAFEKGLAVASITERAASTTLDNFTATAQNNAVTRFSDSSENVHDELVRSIPAQLLATRQFDSTTTGGQIGELGRQLDRQRGGLGVRSLLDRFGPLISELVPCMLMSPESVARFFTARSNLFDIVVFDEASQVRVADAVGAMGRGRSVVVVGDSKQMPPTSFAEATIAQDDSDRYDAVTVQDEESILSECVTAQVPSKALTWHYRSQDESLISFSNEHYYGNLSSFPSPLHGAADDGIAGHGISLVRVNGKFLRSATGKDLRTNPVEADAIVDEIERRFWASPDEYPSLGVVTFNAQQRALIEAKLRDASNPRIVEALETKSEGLFVKNLENVQGDERDTILFSTAFSANEKGDLPLNFGPVSQVGGERRLNVAITRARRQVVLFSSFDPKDLRAEESTSQGLKDLKAYLELAQNGVAKASSRFREETVDRHREQIAAVLRAQGLAVTTDVGLSDFRVDLSVANADDPATPLVAILLDNPSWARRRTVADRDGLPLSVLKNLMKWPGVVRIWMPEWLSDQSASVERIIESVETAKAELELSRIVIEPDTSSIESIRFDQNPDLQRDLEPELTRNDQIVESPVPTRSASLEPARGASAAAIGREESFTPWATQRRGNVAVLDRLPARDAASQVQSVIEEVVTAEGPVHAVRLAKLVAGAFGLDRVAQARVQAILKCVPSEYRVTGDRTYYWHPQTDAAGWSGFRRSLDSDGRDFEHVHPKEIVNAMKALCVRSAGLYEDELRRETLNFFGLKRMTPKMVSVLDAALKRGFDSGELVRTGEGVVAAG